MASRTIDVDEEIIKAERQIAEAIQQLIQTNKKEKLTADRPIGLTVWAEAQIEESETQASQ